MKNSKEHAAKVAKFVKTAMGGKVVPPEYGDPVEAMIYGVVSELLDEAKAAAVYKAMQEQFVDWNDLRVSRLEEIAELLNEPNEVAEAVSTSLSLSLNHIFNVHDCVNLAALPEDGKRSARKTLSDMPGLSEYVIDYIMLTSLGGHAIPLTVRMVAYLKEHDLVDAEATNDDIQGFLQRQVAAADGYTFYVALREKAEQPVCAVSGTKSVKTARARASAGATAVKTSADETSRKKPAAKAKASGAKKQTVKKAASKKVASKKKVAAGKSAGGKKKSAKK